MQHIVWFLLEQWQVVGIAGGNGADLDPDVLYARSVPLVLPEEAGV
ncbi:MAG: hypothetical protein K6U74_05120 [Firmicutes bacterium]|nr:hypothetical protein [Bacillota bacterium]